MEKKMKVIIVGENKSLSARIVQFQSSDRWMWGVVVRVGETILAHGVAYSEKAAKRKALRALKKMAKTLDTPGTRLLE